MHIGIVSFSDVESALDLSNILIDSGQRVTLYLPYKRACYLVNREENQIESFYAMELLPKECQLRIIRFPRVRNPLSLITVMRLLKILRNDRLDIVHIMIGPLEIWSSILVQLIKFIPKIITLVIPKPNFGENMPAAIEIAINRIGTLGNHAIIVNGEKMVDEVVNTYRVLKERIHHIPLMPRNYLKTQLKNAIDLEQSTVLFIGRALPHKGLEYLIRAEPLISKEVPGSSFLIAIHGENASYINEVLGPIRKNPKFEIHEGFMTAESMASHFARATVVALPYLTASTSGVLLDSYSFGKPVVATSVGSLPEYVVDGKTGIIIPPADVEALANAVNKLLQDISLRKQMSTFTKKWIRELQNKNVLMLLDLYQRAIKSYCG